MVYGCISVLLVYLTVCDFYMFSIDLLSELEDGKASRAEVEERAVTAEHRCSALQLDLKQKEVEVTGLMQQLKEVETQLENESRLRFQAQSNIKREQEKMREEQEILEQEMKDQVCGVMYCADLCVMYLFIRCHFLNQTNNNFKTLSLD